MFKIALNAGHGLNTAGKRCLKSIDPNETREWVLNSRIAEKITENLKEYSGYELLRIDDPTGKTDIALKARTDKANKWGADFYLAVHHNAGIGGGAGGGIVAFTYTSVDGETKDWQKSLYDSLIKYTGLKGNRSTPLAKADFHECRETKMPAVLLECGFMDSTADTPVILTEQFADKCAAAITEVIVKKGGLTKKTAGQKPAVPDKKPDGKISVIYQIWDSVQKRWLPDVKDLTDYAGLYGHALCAVYARLTSGNIFYRVHYTGGDWLPEVKNREDYAGLYGKSVDGLMMRTDTGRKIKYALHIKDGDWLPYVSGYDEKDPENGYAGILGKEADAVRIYIE